MNVLKTKILQFAAITKRIVSKDRTVTIFTPSGEGSIGDQAMLDSLSEKLASLGKSIIIVYLPGWKPTEIRFEHKTINLSGKSPWPLELAMAVFRSRSVVTVGADVMDGTYGDWMPIEWVNKLIRARQVGASAGIINFSFSSEPAPAVTALLRTVKNLGFTPRDPVSFERFVAATGQAATLSADLAFLLTPELRSPNAQEADRWLAARKTAGDCVLIANLSGHTLSRMSGDGIAVMKDALRRWLQASQNRSLFLLPHDFRPAPIGDVEALEQVYASLATEFPDRVAMIKPPFAAWDVKALCGRADLAISGRMHLAIACLGMAVPVVSVVYVGKFEGLMQHIGLAEEDLLLSTEEALDAELILSKIERVTREKSRLSSLIKSRLEAVRALSAKNFDWL